ncbi:MAG: ATP-grasp domain-containing protein [Erysipelotrichaceae bacterium]
MSIYVIYDKSGYEKNVVFVNLLMEEFNKYGYQLRLVLSEDIDNYKFSAQDIIIFRTINIELAKKLKCCRLINDLFVIEYANDKYKMNKYIEELGLNCEPCYLNSSDDLVYPYILKSLDGHGGSEVYYIDSDYKKEMVLSSINKDYLTQKFINATGDVRVYVINNNIVKAVKRTNDHDFRFNYSLNGNIELFEIDDKLRYYVNKILRNHHYDYVGIDFLIVNNDYIFNEIEDVVGSRMLYHISDIKIHEMLVTYILTEVL